MPVHHEQNPGHGPMVHRKSRMAIILMLVAVMAGGGCMQPIRNRPITPSVRISVAPELDLGESEIQERIDRALRESKKKLGYCNEIVVYTLSSIKERYTYADDGNDTIVVDLVDGSVEALLKIKSGGAIIDIVFITCNGATKAQMIDALTVRILDVIR